MVPLYFLSKDTTVTEEEDAYMLVFLMEKIFNVVWWWNFIAPIL